MADRVNASYKAFLLSDSRISSWAVLAPLLMLLVRGRELDLPTGSEWPVAPGCSRGRLVLSVCYSLSGRDGIECGDGYRVSPGRRS